MTRKLLTDAIKEARAGLIPSEDTDALIAESVGPDIHLQEYEAEGAMPCGCKLADSVDDDTQGAAFFMCVKHAAAPELLTACRALLSQIEENGWTDCGPVGAGWKSSGLAAHIFEAEAAIAKAEGRSHE